MTETESELHSRLEERDAEIEGLKDEITRLKAKRRESSIERLNILSALGQMGQQRDEARAAIARVRAIHVKMRDCDTEKWVCIECGFAWPCDTANEVATQPTEARP